MTTKLLVLSSVSPTESGGGELVLRRHLAGLDPNRWSIHLANIGSGREAPGDWPLHRVARLPLAERLMRTRLAPRLNDEVFSGRLVSRWALGRLIDRIRPDVLLTVAHGELAPLACWAANEKGIPLVTLFHDWWPDVANCTPKGRLRLEAQFLELHRASSAALCVCDGFVGELPVGSNTQVLYPIPGPRVHSRLPHPVDAIPGRPLQVAYSGTLAGAYGEMVMGLASETLGSPQVDFNFCGPASGNPLWSATRGYFGCLSSSDYRKFIRLQDLLIVTMSFGGQDQRRARTSFPSKLLEYCQTGLPLLIWGPAYCSAVRWATPCDAAEVVTDPAPAAVFEALRRLKADPKRLETLAQRAREAAASEFHPDRIQSQFEAALAAAAGCR